MAKTKKIAAKAGDTPSGLGTGGGTSTGAAAGAATGAAVGSLLGPLGAAAGAVIGGVAGANALEKSKTDEASTANPKHRPATRASAKKDGAIAKKTSTKPSAAKKTTAKRKK